MASRADDRTAEDVCQRVMPAHALQMALIRRKRSSLKRRSPTEEEVPYTAADRLVAQRRSPSFPVGTKVRIYEANSDCLVNAEVMKQNEDDGSFYVEYKVGDRYYGKSISQAQLGAARCLALEEEQAVAADNPDDK